MSGCAGSWSVRGDCRESVAAICSCALVMEGDLGTL